LGFHVAHSTTPDTSVPFQSSTALLNAGRLDKRSAAALQGDEHRTDCCTLFLSVHRQNQHNRNLQVLVLPVLTVHKEKRKAKLLLLLLLLMMLMLIAAFIIQHSAFSVQMHSTPA